MSPRDLSRESGNRKAIWLSRPKDPKAQYRDENDFQNADCDPGGVIGDCLAEPD